MDFTEKGAVAPGACAHRAMPEPQPDPRGWMNRRSGFVLLGFLAITGFLLFTEHRAHVFGLAPFVLLALCLLLHLFHHGGHGNHAHRGEHGRDGGSGAHRHTGGGS